MYSASINKIMQYLSIEDIFTLDSVNKAIHKAVQLYVWVLICERDGFYSMRTMDHLIQYICSIIEDGDYIDYNIDLEYGRVMLLTVCVFYRDYREIIYRINLHNCPFKITICDLYKLTAKELKNG